MGKGKLRTLKILQCFESRNEMIERKKKVRGEEEEDQRLFLGGVWIFGF